MLLGRKEKEVEKLIVEFFGKVKMTLPELAKMIEDYMSRDKQFKEDAYQVHIHEHEADEIRRRTLLKLYAGAFLPFYREDYIVLMSSGDEIANKAESVASYLVLTRPAIPDFLEEGVKELAAATVATFKPLEEMLIHFQDDYSKVPKLAGDVESAEQKVDRLQWEMTKSVFKSDLSLAEKLHLKAFIDQIAAISDQIEDVADRFEIMLAKRPS